MVCPFMNEVVDVEAQIIQRLLRREKVIRRRLDVLLFSEERRSIYVRDTVSSLSLSFILTIFSGHINQILHIVDCIIIKVNFMHCPSTLRHYNIGDVMKKMMKR